MASGAGKTYTAITIKLGEQAEQEFMAYQPTDDNRNT